MQSRVGIISGMGESELKDKIVQIVRQYGPVTSGEVRNVLSEHKVEARSKQINVLLSELSRSTLLIRDVNAEGVPTYRVRTGRFEASSGLEVKLFHELIKRGIVTEENASLGLRLRNRRNGKTYSLDIAVQKEGKKFNIEVDDFRHIRADALRSISSQLEQDRKLKEIDIDWMDNRVSFTDFKSFDSKVAYRWCIKNLPWCIRYHEELIKPKDNVRSDFLRENGWVVMRVWNKEITEDLERCVREIGEWIS
jgi:hypothetical protein